MKAWNCEECIHILSGNPRRVIPPVPSEKLRAALVGILETEQSGRPIGMKQFWEYDAACRRDGMDVDPYELLEVVRGKIASPDGTHEAFPGERCLYCNANALDVQLYALDEHACPPDWSCGERHPTERLPFCKLAIDHDGKHYYEWFEWPQGSGLPDGMEMEGPPVLRTISW